MLSTRSRGALASLLALSALAAATAYRLAQH